MLIKQGHIIGLEWYSDSIFHLANSSEYHVDILLYEQENFGYGGGKLHVTWSYITLDCNLSNTGATSVSVPTALDMFNGTKTYYAHSPYIVILIKVAINTSTIDANSFNNYLLALKAQNDLEVPGRWTHVLFRKYWTTSESLCSGWLNDDILKYNVVPSDHHHCPCNVFQAELPNSGFEQQLYPGGNIVNQFVHNNSLVCYYSVE